MRQTLRSGDQQLRAITFWDLVLLNTDILAVLTRSSVDDELRGSSVSSLERPVDLAVAAHHFRSEAALRFIVVHEIPHSLDCALAEEEVF